MKKLYTLILVLSFTLSVFAQTGFYVKYDVNVEASGEQAEMMSQMMSGSTMELAANKERTWVKSKIGSMMTTEISFNIIVEGTATKILRL
jgi:hypothetical protein